MNNPFATQALHYHGLGDGADRISPTSASPEKPLLAPIPSSLWSSIDSYLQLRVPFGAEKVLNVVLLCCAKVRPYRFPVRFAVIVASDARVQATSLACTPIVRPVYHKLTGRLLHMDW